MQNIKHLTNKEIRDLSFNLCLKIVEDFRYNSNRILIYAIPRGGVPVSYLCTGFLPFNFIIADSPQEADIFIDDIIDSGKTRDRFLSDFPSAKFYALIEADKENPCWYVFPWEGNSESSIEDAYIRLGQFFNCDHTKIKDIITKNLSIQND